MQGFSRWHFLFLLPGLFLLWFGLGTVPLEEKSEGRYGLVSLHMAGMLDAAPRVDDTGHAVNTDQSAWSRLLVPMYFDPENPEVLHPHLTKPPLTYWLQSALLNVLGPTAWAIRMPSALAGSAVLLLTYWLARRMRGGSYAAACACVLSVMPIFLVVSRLGLTDALLAMGWWGALVFGFLAVTDGVTLRDSQSTTDETQTPRRWRWIALLWVSVAWGLMTKGPVAWLPVGVLVVWLALAGRRRDVRRLWLVPGMVLSALPLVSWALLVWKFNPHAIEVWHAEMVKRAVGSGDHPEPVWFFAAYFLFLFAPATMAMRLPLLHYPIHAAWRRMRSSDESGSTLWALAVVIPFIVFSLVKGKLLSYMLPLSPPLAMLAGLMIARWIDAGAGVAGAEPEPVRGSGERWPELRWPSLVTGVVLGVGAQVGVWLWLGPAYLWLSMPAVALALSPIYTIRVWRRRPDLRGRAIAIGYAVIVLAWLAIFTGHIRLFTGISAPATLAKIHAILGDDFETSKLVTIGYADPTMSFYRRQVVPSVSSRELNELIAQHAGNLVVLADTAVWDTMCKSDSQTATKLVEVMRVSLWPRQPKRVLLLPASTERGVHSHATPHATPPPHG